MEQFNLDKWLQDKSRKVVTRDGREVRIICWDSPNKTFPIVGFVNNEEEIFAWDYFGYCREGHIETDVDLFFADDEEELTEFDYAVLSIISDHNSHKDSIGAFAKRSSKKLLELARKELEKDIEHSAVEFAKSYMEDVNPSFEKVKESEELWKWKMSCLRGVNKAYTQGKQDALKDLPKWKKACKHTDFNEHVIILVDDDNDSRPFLDDVVKEGEFYLELKDIKKLPKEE
jgi:hypothetical protein